MKGGCGEGRTHAADAEGLLQLQHDLLLPDVCRIAHGPYRRERYALVVSLVSHIVWLSPYQCCSVRVVSASTVTKGDVGMTESTMS